MVHFQWGETQRSGVDHIITVPHDDEYITICPRKDVERLIALGEGVGWNMTSGYSFSDTSIGRAENHVGFRDQLPQQKCHQQ